MVKVYFAQLIKEIKILLQYKKQTIINLSVQVVFFFTSYFTTIAMFSKFNNIGGFTLNEVFICYGVVYLGFSFMETFFRGIDTFEKLLITGSFDRLLVRPRSVLVQVLCNELDLIKIVRIIQAFIVLAYGVVNLDVVWTIDKIYMLIGMIISSIILFLSLAIIMATYCFYTLQGLEVRNLVLDGGKNIGQYPLNIYHKSIKFVLTYIIPFALMNYYPILYICGRCNNKLILLSPIVISLYIIPAVLIFNRGLKHYNSTGS